jgi:hypothetical protein
MFDLTLVKQHIRVKTKFISLEVTVALLMTEMIYEWHQKSLKTFLSEPVQSSLHQK